MTCEPCEHVVDEVWTMTCELVNDMWSMKCELVNLVIYSASL
jgi:hypothetical protein